MRLFPRLAVAGLAATCIAVAPVVSNAATRASGPAAGTITAVDLAPASYSLALSGGLIGLSTGDACSTELRRPATLRLVRTARSCGPRVAPASGVHLSVAYEGGGPVIRVARTDPHTHHTTLGPVLARPAEWDWAHSTVAEGGGAIWYYDPGRRTLFEVSTRTARVVGRFRVTAGEVAYLAVDADGLWLLGSTWGGSFWPKGDVLYHVAPGSNRLVTVARLGVGAQWFVASGHALFADVLTRVRRAGYRQTIWRLDGPHARVAYRRPASLLPSDVFAPGTGYLVLGNARLGLFTLSQLGRGRTPIAVGACDTSAPMRVVRVDPATGAQAYVATIPRAVVGAATDCHLTLHQALLADHALFFLGDANAIGSQFGDLVRVQL